MPRQAQAQSTGRDYKAYADKEPTQAMTDYHAWLQEKTGLKLDLKSVALAGTLRMDFQKDMRENGSPRAHNNRGAQKPAAATTKTASKAAAPKRQPAGKESRTAAKTASKPAAKNTSAPAAKNTSAPAAKNTSAPKSGRRGKVAAPAEAPY